MPYPDVAFDANPNTGVSVYDSTPVQQSVGLVRASAAPALVRRTGRECWPLVRHSAATLQTAKKIYGGGYRFDLRDVTSGTERDPAVPTAQPEQGYDLMTRLGSPINQPSPGELPSGAVLTSGQSITTPNGQYSLTMETNGNTVE